MPTYILLSLLAAVCFSLTGIFNKVASKHSIANKWEIIFYYYATYLPFVFILPFFGPIRIPADWTPLIWQTVFFFLGNICFFTAIYKIDASTAAPFFQLQAVFVGILAYLFLGERFPPTNYLWIGIIFIGILLVSYNEKLRLRSFFNQAIGLIVAMQLFHAASNLFAGKAMQTMDSWNVNFWSSVISNPVVILLLPPLAKIKPHFSWRRLQYLFLAGFFSLVGATSLYAAYRTNLTISSILSLLTAPIVLIISIFLSRFRPEFLEHHPPGVYAVRGLGIMIILAGVIKISLG